PTNMCMPDAPAHGCRWLLRPPTLSQPQTAAPPHGGHRTMPRGTRPANAPARKRRVSLDGVGTTTRRALAVDSAAGLAMVGPRLPPHPRAAAGCLLTPRAGGLWARYPANDTGGYRDTSGSASRP